MRRQLDKVPGLTLDEQAVYPLGPFDLAVVGLVVTNISLIGWLVSNATRTTVGTVALAVISVAFITAGVIVLHRQIERRIDQVGEL